MGYETYSLDAIDTFRAEILWCWLWETHWLSEYRMCQSRVCFSAKRPFSKEELESEDAQGPPVDRVKVATLGEHLWRYVNCAQRQSSLG
jgi:hypothetical protein